MSALVDFSTESLENDKKSKLTSYTVHCYQQDKHVMVMRAPIRVLIRVSRQMGNPSQVDSD